MLVSIPQAGLDILKVGIDLHPDLMLLDQVSIPQAGLDILKEGSRRGQRLTTVMVSIPQAGLDILKDLQEFLNSAQTK